MVGKTGLNLYSPVLDQALRRALPSVSGTESPSAALADAHLSQKPFKRAAVDEEGARLPCDSIPFYGDVAGPVGFEPTTSWVRTRRSSS